MGFWWPLYFHGEINNPRQRIVPTGALEKFLLVFEPLIHVQKSTPLTGLPFGANSSPQCHWKIRLGHLRGRREGVTAEEGESAWHDVRPRAQGLTASRGPRPAGVFEAYIVQISACLWTHSWHASPVSMCSSPQHSRLVMAAPASPWLQRARLGHPLLLLFPFLVFLLFLFSLGAPDRPSALSTIPPTLYCGWGHLVRFALTHVDFMFLLWCVYVFFLTAFLKMCPVKQCDRSIHTKLAYNQRVGGAGFCRG